MKHIWKVIVTLDDGDNWDLWHVEAKDDVEAREKAIELTKANAENPKIEYAETKHVLEFED